VTGRRGARAGAGGEGDEHRAAEAEIRDTEASPDDGRWRLEIGRHSGGAGTATRVHDRAEVVRGADGCFVRRRKQVRLCLGSKRIRVGWRRRTGRCTWPTSAAELGPLARGRAASART
jgi:hypothetical protein